MTAWRLLNTTARPVELHLTAGVVVIAPSGQADVTQDDLELGQVRALRAGGVVVAREVPEADTAAETAPKPARRRARKRKTTPSRRADPRP